LAGTDLYCLVNRGTCVNDLLTRSLRDSEMAVYR